MLKNQQSKDRNGDNKDGFNSSKSMMKRRKKNQQRLGGGGLLLEVFANAKSKNDDYNPAIIKKQREFYKNAICVNKYKKSLKQLNETQNQPPLASRLVQEDNETVTDRKPNKQNKGNKSQSLGELYESKRQEEETARMEKEALLRAKKEARERTEARRKEQR